MVTLTTNAPGPLEPAIDAALGITDRTVRRDADAALTAPDQPASAAPTRQQHT